MLRNFEEILEDTAQRLRFTGRFDVDPEESAIRRILEGYRDDEEALGDARYLKKIGLTRFDIYGYPIGPMAIREAVARKEKFDANSENSR